MTSAALFSRAAPVIFVLLWATGFVVARLVVPHAEPLTFLTIRYLCTIAVLGVVALVMKAEWPATIKGWRDALIAGILLQGVYLGGVFLAIDRGLPAGISSLVVGLQPLLTAVLAAPLVGERVGPRRWLGIIIGFLGAALVLAPRLGVVGGFAPVALGYSVAAMIGITLGTMWQKRTAATSDLQTNAVVQFVGAVVVTLPIAALVEEGRFDGSVEVWAALAWTVFGLSIGAISLLLLLIRRGEVARVATLFYLVPPVSALMAYAIFGENLTLVQIVGMVVAAAGVAIASRN